MSCIKPVFNGNVFFFSFSCSLEHLHQDVISWFLEEWNNLDPAAGWIPGSENLPIPWWLEHCLFCNPGLVYPDCAISGSTGVPLWNAGLLLLCQTQNSKRPREWAKPSQSSNEQHEKAENWSGVASQMATTMPVTPFTGQSASRCCPASASTFFFMSHVYFFSPLFKM